MAAAAIDAGATIVNDVTALQGDLEMASVCAEHGVDVVLMHMPGNPRTMQDDPRYDDVVDEVKAFLSAARSRRRSPPVSTKSGSGLTRGSGSARRSSTTWSCCGGWGSCGSSAGRW